MFFYEFNSSSNYDVVVLNIDSIKFKSFVLPYTYSSNCLFMDFTPYCICMQMFYIWFFYSQLIWFSFRNRKKFFILLLWVSDFVNNLLYLQLQPKTSVTIPSQKGSRHLVISTKESFFLSATPFWAVEWDMENWCCIPFSAREWSISFEVYSQ